MGLKKLIQDEIKSQKELSKKMDVEAEAKRRLKNIKKKEGK